MLSKSAKIRSRLGKVALYLIDFEDFNIGALVALIEFGRVSRDSHWEARLVSVDRQRVGVGQPHAGASAVILNFIVKQLKNSCFA